MSLFKAGPTDSSIDVSVSSNGGLTKDGNELSIKLDPIPENPLSLSSAGLLSGTGFYGLRFVRYAGNTTLDEFEYSTGDSEKLSDASYVLPTESIILGGSISAFSFNFIPNTSCSASVFATSFSTGVIFEDVIEKPSLASSAVVSFNPKPRIPAGFEIGLISNETRTYTEQTVFAYTIYILPILSDPFLDLSNVVPLGFNVEQVQRTDSNRTRPTRLQQIQPTASLQSVRNINVDYPFY